MNDSTNQATLVTGGAGYIGAHLVRMLRESGIPVVVADDFSTGSADRIPDVPVLVVDLAEPANATRLSEFMTDTSVGAVMHLAGRKRVDESMREPSLYFQQNVGQLATTLSAMKRAGVQDIVFSSTAAVYGHVDDALVTEEHAMIPASPYGASKLVGEQLLDWEVSAGNIRAISLRYFNVAGAGWENLGDTARINLVSIILDRLTSDRPPVIYGSDYNTPDGTCLRDFIHVLDLCEAHVRALAYMRSVRYPEMTAFNIGTGTGSSVREVINMLTRLYGARQVEPLLAPRRAGDSPAVVADPAAFRSATGWTASRTPHDILSSAVSAWQSAERAS